MERLLKQKSDVSTSRFRYRKLKSFEFEREREKKNANFWNGSKSLISDGKNTWRDQRDGEKWNIKGKVFSLTNAEKRERVQKDCKIKWKAVHVLSSFFFSSG